MWYFVLFLIGLIIGYYGHLFLNLYNQKKDRKEKENPIELNKEIEEDKKTLDLLKLAIKQKKDEKYKLVQQNIELRHENQDLIDLRKTTEELQKKALSDGMKIYIPEKDKKNLKND